MALMGSDQAKMGQNDQTLAVLEWLRTEGAQNLLKQVAAGRAQRADEPDIQRGQEEVQRRRDTAVHDWLNTPEAQRFLMGREDADIAMRQQGQRGPGSGEGPPTSTFDESFRAPPRDVPQPRGQFAPPPIQDTMRQATSGYGQMGDPRAQMLEQLMAAGAANPDFDRGPYTPGAFEQQPRGQFAPPPGPPHQRPGYERPPGGGGDFSMMGIRPGQMQPGNDPRMFNRSMLRR
jgi:hypothetical protein